MAEYTKLLATYFFLGNSLAYFSTVMMKTVGSFDIEEKFYMAPHPGI
jgi:hypothetical protein